MGLDAICPVVDCLTAHCKNSAMHLESVQIHAKQPMTDHTHVTLINKANTYFAPKLLRPASGSDMASAIASNNTVVSGFSSWNTPAIECINDDSHPHLPHCKWSTIEQVAWPRVQTADGRHVRHPQRASRLPDTSVGIAAQTDCDDHQCQKALHMNNVTENQSWPRRS